VTKVPRRLLKLKGEITTGILRKLHNCFVLGSPASVLDSDMCYPESQFFCFFSYFHTNSMVKIKLSRDMPRVTQTEGVEV
jgi:hypothetical protein